MLPSCNPWLNCSMSLTALSTYGVSLPFNCSTNGVSWLESASTAGMAALNVLRNDSSASLPGPSPNRLRAAFTFAKAPLNVSPAANAAPPNPSCMASAKVWKSILPFETMSDTSSEVVLRCLASIWRTGTPELISWSMSSPWSLPRAATDPKMVPMSVSDRPEICAVSATVLRTLVICSPDAMPAADRLAATVAASPNPNAVPFTLASALFMISLTLLASWPRPLSLACAFSMFRARVKPPFAASAVTPPVMVPMAPSPSLPILPNALPRVPVRLPPLFLAAVSTLPVMSPSRVLPKSLPEGATCTYTVPMSCAIGVLHPDSGVGSPIAVGASR